jgi:hypothetical protein
MGLYIFQKQIFKSQKNPGGKFPSKSKILSRKEITMKKLRLEDNMFHVRTLSEDEYDTVVKGLRLMVLVGNEEEGLTAAFLVSELIAEKT